MRKAKIFTLLLIFTLLSGFGLRCANKQVQEAMKPVSLNYWRVWDEADDFDDIIKTYQLQHPYVSINYRRLRYSEYEKELLEAFAEDRVPDIFSIHNTWVKKYQTKIKPMPEATTMVYPIEKGTIKKQIINELRTTKSLTLKELRDNFLDVVYGDVVVKSTDEKTNQVKDFIFALPLSVDTLVMYYNKDLFNNAGIIDYPRYWNKDFQKIVKNLTKQDIKGQIIQSGVALGGSSNIERYSDILSVLMMQNGTEMLNNSGRVLFASTPSAYQEQKFVPGLEALQFYCDFANPAKEVYSWNDNLDNSLDMFIKGKLAIFFGYAYHQPTIKAKAPKLNYVIVPLPQIEGNSAVNFANYWVETVSKKSRHPDEAWDFIQFAARAENVKSYLDKTKKPTALRSLIEEQQKNPEMEVFANQLLTAKSWYKGKDSNVMEEIFKEMIDKVNAGQEAIGNIIGQGASKVQQTIN